MAMFVITRGYIPLNPIKPPFSLWFSYVLLIGTVGTQHVPLGSDPDQTGRGGLC